MYVIQLGNVLNRSTYFIDRITNQRFCGRRSRFDDAFEGNGVPVE